MSVGRSWTLDDARLRKLVGQNLSDAVISERLSRPIKSVGYRKHQLGLTKPRDTAKVGFDVALCALMGFSQ